MSMFIGQLYHRTVHFYVLLLLLQLYILVPVDAVWILNLCDKQHPHILLQHHNSHNRNRRDPLQLLTISTAHWGGNNPSDCIPSNGTD